MREHKATFRLLAADARGGVAVVFGLTIVVVLFTVSICLDLVRAYNVRTHLQTALDAAALTGAKLLQEDGATDQTVQTAAAAMFNTYVPNLNMYGLTTANFKATPDWTSSTVTTTIDAKVTSFFSKIAAGIAPNLTMTPSSTVSYKADKVEVALVVDVTGSMNQIPAGDTQTKMQSLKQAASIVVDTLMADSPSEDAVRIAVVPFSASVNAGALANATSASPSVTTCGSTWGWGYSCTTVAGADIDTCVIERDHSHEDASPSSNKIPAVPSTPYGNYSCPPATVIPLQGKAPRRPARRPGTSAPPGAGTCCPTSGRAYCRPRARPYRRPTRARTSTSSS
jgi:Flp pilus assembly protein TadG